MTSQPTIMILEDERPQLLAVRAALHGLGTIRDFADPQPALDFLKGHAVDAAIVDIHMPQFQINGMDFIRSVREFDKELCVIIRTGDASSDLADSAIEVRAFRRAIKGRTTIEQLRELTVAAVNETRCRRQASMDAANTTSVKTQWVETLGSIDEAMSVTESYKGLLHGIRNQLTAIGGVAELLAEAAKGDQAHLLNQHVRTNKQLVERLLAEVNGFLNGPFSDTLRTRRSESRTTVNGLLDSLRTQFLGASQNQINQVTLSIAGLSQDMYISASPLKLLIAIRHLVEFCLHRGSPTSTIRLTTHCIDRATSAIDSISGPKLVFTESLLNSEGVYLVIRLTSSLRETSLEEIRRSFADYPNDPHSGNLQMIPLALRGELAAVTVHRDPQQRTEFNLYVPIAR